MQLNCFEGDGYHVLFKKENKEKKRFLRRSEMLGRRPYVLCKSMTAANNVSLPQFKAVLYGHMRQT